ncbi:MAG TPA: hypothetical protein VGJ13_16065 [Pseudonocardiaceae bacterium]
MRIWARARASMVACPACGVPSARARSRCDRRLADAAVIGLPIVSPLSVRRLSCYSRDCPARAFAEQAPGLAVPCARRGPAVRGMLEVTGLAVAGRAGARLADLLGLPASRNTLLRLVRAVPGPVSRRGAGGGC